MTSVKNRLWGSRRRKFASLLVTMMLVGGGVALAAWLINSNGHGAGRIGSLSTPTIVAGSPTGAALYPNGDGDGVFTITNTNNTPLVVTGTDPGGANASGVCYDYVTVNSLTGLNIPVPTGISTVTVPNVFHLDGSAGTGCMGGTFEKDATLHFSTP
jgi:hypothetical protein